MYTYIYIERDIYMFDSAVNFVHPLPIGKVNYLEPNTNTMIVMITP